VQLDHRGYIQVDSQLCTTAPHIFAPGDVTGHLMVVHEAVREAQARKNSKLVVATRFDSVARPLIAGRESRAILGCHIVGERRSSSRSSRPSRWPRR
jgi:Pyridine nucleotide-disulphide oxidoreductase